MKVRNILSAAVAAVVAASAMSAIAFAGEQTVEMTEDDNVWWSQTSFELVDLIGEENPEDVASITFACEETDIQIAYNAFAEDGGRGEWTTTDKAKEIVFDLSLSYSGLDDDGNMAYDGLSVIAAPGEVMNYTITWTVNMKGEEPETPTGPDFSTFDQEKVGGKLDLAALAGDLADVAKIEVTFKWVEGWQWCGGAGLADFVTASGEVPGWVASSEYGNANANADLYADKTEATFVLYDYSEDPIAQFWAPVLDKEGEPELDEDGNPKTVAASLDIQNWWNGQEAGAWVATIKLVDSTGAEKVYDLEKPARVDEVQPNIPEDESSEDESSEDETSEDTSSSTPDKGTPNTGFAGVAAVAGVAVVAAGAIVLSKKRS